MRSIGKLFHALANLAGSINALASVIDRCTGQLANRLDLDDPTPSILEHNEHDDPHSNGTTKGRKKAGTE